MLVCGGRDYADRRAVFQCLTDWQASEGCELLIHGDAPGADALAKEWAYLGGTPTRAFPADWPRLGRAAGPTRNQQMIEEGRPDVVLAFPGGRGTADMMQRARAAGVRVIDLRTESTMIARKDGTMDGGHPWAALAEAAPVGVTFSATTVRLRLDAVVPGEWDVTLDLLPDRGGACAFKARLQILGVIREGVGSGPTYEQAADAALVAVARRFGISAGEVIETALLDAAIRELDMVPARDTAVGDQLRRSDARREAKGAETASAPEGEPACPKCSGRMWDNRVGKRNPKAPDFKCRDKSCDGVIWPPKNGAPAASAPVLDTAPLGGDDEDLPPWAR